MSTLTSARALAAASTDAASEPARTSVSLALLCFILVITFPCQGRLTSNQEVLDSFLRDAPSVARVVPFEWSSQARAKDFAAEVAATSDGKEEPSLARAFGELPT